MAWKIGQVVGCEVAKVQSAQPVHYAGGKICPACSSNATSDVTAICNNSSNSNVTAEDITNSTNIVEETAVTMQNDINVSLSNGGIYNDNNSSISETYTVSSVNFGSSNIVINSDIYINIDENVSFTRWP